MKTLKIIVIIVFVILMFLFVFRDSGRLNLEGKWKPTKIILAGEDILSASEINKYFDASEIEISSWPDSLQISIIGQQSIKAKFELRNPTSKSSSIKLSSNEKSLNGKFSFEIDTLHISSRTYRVSIKIKSNNTELDFEREKTVPPWRPRFPRRGEL